MREKIELVVSGNNFYVHAPNERLGDLAYWNENFHKTVKDDVESYLGRQGWEQQIEIMQLAKDFHEEENPVSPTVSLIPVAAHQESERIVPAMAEFARQKTNEPFSILLYLNTPEGADYRAIKKTLHAIKQAKQTYPELDIRSSDIYEFTNPTIGKLRKNLWDSALYLAYYDGLFDSDRDVVGLNQDIDIVRMSRSVIRSVQQHYADRRQPNKQCGTNLLKPAGTQLRHAYDHRRPNVSKVVQWRDLICHVRTARSTYEAGVVVPLSTYARSGGMSDDATLGETKNIIYASGLDPRIKHTAQTTSPRRFSDRLHNTNLNNVWTDDSFGVHDTCRTDQLPGDISEARAKHVIRNSLGVHVPWLFYQAAADYDVHKNESELVGLVTKRHRLCTTVLRRLDNSGELTNLVSDTYPVNTIVQDIKDNQFKYSLYDL